MKSKQKALGQALGPELRGQAIEAARRLSQYAKNQYDYAKTLGILVTEYEIAVGNRVEVSLVGLSLLKEIVQQSGVTQAKLASIMGIEQGTVSKIMTGARSITVDHAKRLAKHFKVRAFGSITVFFRTSY